MRSKDKVLLYNPSVRCERRYYDGDVKNSYFIIKIGARSEIILTAKTESLAWSKANNLMKKGLLI